MPTINNCPLCGRRDCVESVRFEIDGKWYTGFKCNTNGAMLYSVRDESEEQLKYMKGLIDKREGDKL